MATATRVPSASGSPSCSLQRRYRHCSLRSGAPPGSVSQRPSKSSFRAVQAKLTQVPRWPWFCTARRRAIMFTAVGSSAVWARSNGPGAALRAAAGGRSAPRPSGVA
jgi:hypothetical protein